MNWGKHLCATRPVRAFPLAASHMGADKRGISPWLHATWAWTREVVTARAANVPARRDDPWVRLVLERQQCPAHRNTQTNTWRRAHRFNLKAAKESGICSSTIKTWTDTPSYLVYHWWVRQIDLFAHAHFPLRKTSYTMRGQGQIMCIFDLSIHAQVTLQDAIHWNGHLPLRRFLRVCQGSHTLPSLPAHARTHARTHGDIQDEVINKRDVAIEHAAVNNKKD